MSMRHPSQTIMSALFTCCLVLALVACGGDLPEGGSGSGGSGGDDVGPGGAGGDGGSGGETGEEPCGTTPSIRALEPDHGPTATDVWVVGCNFPSGANEAYFNGTRASVYEVNAEGTRLLTRVPEGATTGGIRLLLGPQKVRVDGPVFTVEIMDRKPEITGISPEGTTEARAGSGKTVRVTLSGTNFIPESHVYLQVGSGTPRLLATECSRSSPTAMVCTLGETDLAKPRELKFQVKNEREGIPGGGASSQVSFYVVSHIDLVSAIATTQTRVALTFSRAVGGGRWEFGFTGGLRAKSAKRDPANAKVIHVDLTDAMPPNVDYTVEVGPDLLSDQGGDIWNRTASFRGFNSTPVSMGGPIGIAGGDCTASGFLMPGAIAAAGGQVFVTERSGEQVQVLDPDGTMVGFLGHDGTSPGLHVDDAVAAGCPGTGSNETGAFRNPRGRVVVSTASIDRIVADTDNARVLRFTSAGAYKSVFGSGFTLPVVLALVDQNVWIADADDVIRMVTTSGASAGTTGASGTGDGSFSFGIADGSTPSMVSDGTYAYITEPGNHRVQKIRLADMRPMGWVGVNHVSFQTQGECCSAGTGQAQFTNIRGIAMDTNGYLYVADEANGGRIQKLSKDGQLMMTIGLGFIPGGIEIDGSDILWLTEVAANQVRRYRL